MRVWILHVLRISIDCRSPCKEQCVEAVPHCKSAARPTHGHTGSAVKQQRTNPVHLPSRVPPSPCQVPPPQSARVAAQRHPAAAPGWRSPAAAPPQAAPVRAARSAPLLRSDLLLWGPGWGLAATSPAAARRWRCRSGCKRGTSRSAAARARTPARCGLRFCL